MRGAKDAAVTAASFLVFAFLDLLDFLLCFIYMFVDSVLEDNPAPCFCRNRGSEERGIPGVDGGDGEISETLFERRNIVREMVLGSNKEEGAGSMEKKCLRRSPRWSDCRCEACFSLVDWAGKKPEMLYFVLKETNPATTKIQDHCQNVIFLHGFLSSSSLWVDSVFPNISEDSNTKVKMFAVDLLGFGRSPKPVNCSYTIRDQLEMINTSVIKQFRLSSFHIVAHSMGCILALALAAEFPDSVKSITLVAPPYFSSLEDKASHSVLNTVAERKIWPPLLFGCSVMSWYEHLGRTICFLFCRNHSMWEWIMKLLMWKEQLPSTMLDITKHTHQSAWHTMHNVVCGGAKVMDKYLKTLAGEDILIKIIQGSKDQVVPLECSYNMKEKVPKAELQIIHNADHTTAILDRKEDFTRDLEEICMEKSNEMSTTKSERSYIHWTVQMDTTLSNVLLEQHNMGHKTPNGWKPTAFTAAISALKEICNVNVNKEKITARLKTWNKYYQDVSAMLDTSGFGWDWERHMVKVDSEDVWANYVKAHPSIKHYKGKVIINWCDLGLLCGNDKATGSHAATAGENVIEIDKESFVEESTHPGGDRTFFMGEGSTKKKKKKSGGIDALAEAISSVATSMDKTLLARHTFATEAAMARAQVIYQALGSIPQLKKPEMLKAMDILSRDITKYGVFMTLPNELRLEWLQMQFD